MDNIIFKTPENTTPIKSTIPLKHEPSPKDHFLGGLGEVWPQINPTRKWLQYVWDNPEIQVVQNQDLFWCVIFAHNSCWRFLHLAQYGEDFNCSERFLAIGSGTRRGVGNSPGKVAEWARKNGYLLQSECPTPQYFDACWLPLTKEEYDLGLSNLQKYDIAYKYLADNSVYSLRNGLTFSPVEVAVQPYAYNSKGYIVNSGQNYVHRVALVEEMIDEGNFWAVWDSENKQWLKFSKDYNFGWPMLHKITKIQQSNMTDPLIKKNRKIYSLSKDDLKYRWVYSGSTFKHLFGEYKNNKIRNVVELPTNVAQSPEGSEEAHLTIPANFIFNPEGEVKIDIQGLEIYLKGLQTSEEDLEKDLLINE